LGFYSAWGCGPTRGKDVKRRVNMILLTKRNGDKFLVNEMQIECIEMIPESKVIMMNHDYYLVLEKTDEIIDKISQYHAKVQDIYREITVTDAR
jgi:flagellar protein FlbD